MQFYTEMKRNLPVLQWVWCFWTRNQYHIGLIHDTQGMGRISQYLSIELSVYDGGELLLSVFPLSNESHIDTNNKHANNDNIPSSRNHQIPTKCFNN